MPVSFFAGAERMREEMKVLTVYFSKSGHTEKVARLIQEAAGGDLAEIRVKKGYTGSYWMTVIRGGLEKMRGVRPEIEPLGVDPAEYDVIFLGSPVWWFTAAPAVKSFLDRADLVGKTVCPFLTSGGSPKDSFQDMKALCTGNMENGMHIYFRKDEMMAGEDTVRSWAKACAEAAKRKWLRQKEGK